MAWGVVPNLSVRSKSRQGSGLFQGSRTIDRPLGRKEVDFQALSRVIDGVTCPDEESRGLVKMELQLLAHVI